jgi:serine/threonine-protein kinase
VPTPAALVETAEIPGPYEETVAAAAVTEQPTIGTGADDAGRLTQAGTVLGTPAYMPPEQARGQVEALDERCDVFGLGAILCVILTGAPPYRGPSPTSLRSARQGDLADAHARLDACGADGQLVALCRQCLAADPAARLPHAGEVAGRVTAYLASVQERLEQVRVQQAAAEVRAIEERKRWWVTMAWSLTTVVAISVGTGAWLWWRADRATRQAEAAAHASYLDREVAAALDEAERQQHDLHARLQDERQAARLLSELEEWRGALASAQAAWKRADAVSATGRDALSAESVGRLAALEEQLRADERDRLMAFELDKIRFEASSPVDGNISLWRAAPKLSRVLREAGYDIEQDSPDQSAAYLRQSPIRLPLVAALDFWALVTRDEPLRRRLSEIARQADPDPWRDRVRQPVDWKDASRLESLAREANLATQTPQLLAAVAQRLRLAGGDAPGLLRRAVVEHPRDFWLYFELGHASRDLVEQAGAFRAALSIRPDSAYAYYGLGVVHAADQKLDEAEACYRKAIALDPRYGGAYNNLGILLSDRNRLDESIDCHRNAIALDPDDVLAHVNLGAALQAQRRIEEAIASYRRAIEIDPNKSAAHNNLGTALREAGKLDDAVASFRQAIRLEPKHAMAWCNLGHALRHQGKLAEALPAMRRGHELGSAQGRWVYPSAEWVRETEWFLGLEQKLPAVLRGEVAPADAREHLGFAELCVQYKRRFGDAVRFYAAAFAADPKLAENLATAHRYNAACAAALAAAGQPVGGEKVAKEQAARWRQQSRAWLRQELAAWRDRLRGDPQARTTATATLQHWLTDPDLASVRDEAALRKLPRDEQTDWRQLWSEVAMQAKAPVAP